jgi:GNAT superfamily N-acetyltransferase
MEIAMEWRVESARKSDWDRVREICVLTSPAVQALIGKRRNFFEDFWVEPYQLLRPDWTWVLRSENDDRVLGYLTAAPDTVRFCTQRAWLQRMRLLYRWILGRYGKGTPELRRWLRRSFHLDPHPEKVFGKDVEVELVRKFPAHLHMNLDPAAHGKGGGSLLLQALDQRMRQEGISGVHLFCGTGPMGFYERCGFQVRSRRILPGTTTEVLVMVRALGSSALSSNVISSSGS